MVEENAAQTLNQSAKCLAVYDSGINGAADVLHRNVVKHLDMAGAVVDRDVGCVGTVTIGPFRIGKRRLSYDCAAGPGCNLAKACGAAIGRRCAAICYNNHIGSTAELNSSRFADCLLKLFGRLKNSRAAHYDGARVIGAKSLLHQGGRAMENTKAVERQGERVASNLGEHGLQPLAQCGRANADSNHSVRPKRHARILARPGATTFDEWHGGNAMITALHALAGQSLLVFVIKFGKAALKSGNIITVVVLRLPFVGHKLADRIWQLVFGDEVLPPERHWIDAEIARSHVHETLAEEVSFETSRRAIGADWCLTGHVCCDLDLEGWKTVRTVQKLRRFGWHNATIGADIGAHIPVNLAAQRHHGAVAPASDFKVAVDLA